MTIRYHWSISIEEGKEEYSRWSTFAVLACKPEVLYRTMINFVLIHIFTMLTGLYKTDFFSQSSDIQLVHIIVQKR